MVFKKNALIIPDDTVFDEGIIVVAGDAIIADWNELEFGIATVQRIFVGEHVKLTGNLTADDDIHVDSFSEVRGTVDGKRDVYLGDHVRIIGQLSVERDLDVGDEVEIDDGFKAKGWINIRNPIPLLIYLLTWLLELLRRGKSEEVEKIIQELEGDGEEYWISELYFYLPRESKFTREKIAITGDCYLGKNCLLEGTYYINGEMKIAENTEIQGSLVVKGDLTIDHHVTITGTVECTGHLIIGEEVFIEGDVTGNTVVMDQSATISGTIFAPEGLRFVTEKFKVMEEKIERFEHEIADIAKMLEWPLANGNGDSSSGGGGEGGAE